MDLAVYYVIPEDGDDIEHPNYFSLPSTVSSPTLKDIKKVILIYCLFEIL